MGIVNQPFSYYGGKQKIADKILPYFPKHGIYCEPFCGGASLFFLKEMSPIEVLNDTNSLIFNFFRALQDRTVAKDLLRKIRLSPYSHELYRESKIYCTEFVNTGSIDINAAYYFYANISMAFSHQLCSGWGYGYKSDDNSPKTYKNKYISVRSSIKRLQKAYIENIDAVKCIQRWDKKDTLFYIDPPYVGTDQGHYKGYTQKDFDDLIELLSNIKGKFILSHYSNSNIPPKWWKVIIPTRSSVSKENKNGYREEVIYMNYNPSEGNGATKSLF